MQSQFPIYLTENKIFSNSNKAFSLQDSREFGEKSSNNVIYSEFEALYLLETKQAQLIKNKKSLTEEQAIKLFSKNNKEFSVKYSAFKVLRKKAYIVKTGSKFGTEFRVYDPKSITTHAKWLVFPIKQSNNINPQELIAKSRIAHSSAKKLLLALVDNQDVIFYELDWIKI